MFRSLASTLAWYYACLRDKFQSAFLSNSYYNRRRFPAWYVLGPRAAMAAAVGSHVRGGAVAAGNARWPERLGLVTVEKMTQTLAWAVENPPEEIRILEPPQIRGGLTEPTLAERQAASA